MADNKDGDLNCNHQWEYDDIVICTNPPITHRICIKCGRVEHKSDAIIEPSKFNEVYQRFYSGGNHADT